MKCAVGAALFTGLLHSVRNDKGASSACSNGSSPQATHVLKPLSLRASASEARQSSKIISAPLAQHYYLDSGVKHRNDKFFSFVF